MAFLDGRAEERQREEREGEAMKRELPYWAQMEGLARIEGWARDGCTQAEIARRMGVGVSTLGRWRKAYPEIEEAIKRDGEETDRLVEQALLRRALGYEYTETVTEESARDAGKRKQTIKHVPPDLSAQIFWLKNRKPEKWRDKPEAKQEEHAGVQIVDDI